MDVKLWRYANRIERPRAETTIPAWVDELPITPYLTA